MQGSIFNEGGDTSIDPLITEAKVLLWEKRLMIQLLKDL